MSFPFFEERFTFTQPDGSKIELRGWGDQNAAVFETLEGYTVTKDPVSGFFQYAQVNSDASEFQALGVSPGLATPSALGLAKSQRLNPIAARARGQLGVGLPEPWWKTRRARTRSAKMVAVAQNISAAPPSRQTVGNYVGLCLLIDFPDVPSTITREQVSDFCNEDGYSGFGNSGSVYNYFFDNSIGRLRYTTVVAPYYTAINPRSYYTNPLVPYGQRARELIIEALAFHKSNGFDFSSLTTDADDNVFATNVFYAGTRVNNWSEGLWPHASRLLSPYPLSATQFALDYQITDIGSSLSLGTYCHENGHMLCDFPDLYDYGNQSSGIGAYCLMCAGGNVNKRNPVQISAYLKRLAGWARSVTDLTTGLSATAPAGTNDFFIKRKGPVEYFLVENRQQTGRDASLPDAGLAIWHVDELGSNNNEQMTPGSHYECSLEQADGRFDLEQGIGIGDNTDLFRAGGAASFGNGSAPSSQWWDGSVSGLEISNIGAASGSMSFDVA